MRGRGGGAAGGGPPLLGTGCCQREETGGGSGAAPIGLRAPRSGGGRGASSSGFRAERSHIGQRRAGLWEKGPFPAASSLCRPPSPPPARPPAKMSDMEDDFMCDDEEDYDLVGRGKAREGGSVGRPGGLAGAVPPRPVPARRLRRPPQQQQQPRRVLPREGALTG